MSNDQITEAGPKFAPNSKITLNVGGKVFASTYETLTSQPATFFCGLLEHECPNEAGEYFIDRDYTFFHHILNHLRGISIKHVIEDMSQRKHELELFYEEVLFYCISDLSTMISKLLNFWGIGGYYWSPAYSQIERFRFFAYHKNGTICSLGTDLTNRTMNNIFLENSQKCVDFISVQSVHEGSEEMMITGSQSFDVGKHFWRVTTNMLPALTQKKFPQDPYNRQLAFFDYSYYKKDEMLKFADTNTLPLIQKNDLMRGGTMAIGVYDNENKIMYGIRDPKRSMLQPQSGIVEGECKVYTDGCKIPLSTTTFVEMDGCCRSSNGEDEDLKEISWKKGDVFDVILDCGTGCLSISSPTNGLECSMSGFQFKKLAPAFTVGYLEEAQIKIIHE